MKKLRERNLLKENGEIIDELKEFEDGVLKQKSQLICTIFDSKTKNSAKIVNRTIISNNLLKMYEYGLEFILKNANYSNCKNKAFGYPINALKETLLNALIHSNYNENEITKYFAQENEIDINRVCNSVILENPYSNHKEYKYLFNESTFK